MSPRTRAVRLGGPAAVALFAVVGGVTSRHSVAVVWTSAAVGILAAIGAAVFGLVGWRLALVLLVPIAALTIEGFGQASALSWMGFCAIAMWIGLEARPSIALGLSGVMVGLIAWQFANETSEPGWAAWTIGTVISVVACILARSLQLTNEALRRAQDELAQRTRAEERARIAGEVHDVIGHGLTVTLLHISAARLALEEGPESAEAELAEAERLARSSLAEVRATVGLWREDQGAAPLPAANQIDGLVDTFRQAGMVVDLSISGGLDDIGGTRGLAAYRIVQESLTNAARHAPGAPVEVRVCADGKRLTIRVDSAHRPNPVVIAGSGLRGMDERVSAVGGTLQAGPHGGGWRVEAVLPQ